MATRKTTPCLLALVLWAAGLHASEEAAKPHGPGVPLRLQVVFNRSVGEKTVSSHAYALGVETGGEVTTLKAGLQVPILRDGTTVNFKDAATRIQCAAEDLSERPLQAEPGAGPDGAHRRAHGERPGSPHVRVHRQPHAA